MADQDASFVISARDATKEAFQSATASLQGLGERANEVKELMHQLAAAFAIHEIAHFIGQAIEARAKMEDLAQIAGTTPQELSKFEQPARLAGTSLDTVATAMARLTRSIGEARAGNTEKEAFLKALGVDPETADDSAAAMETVLRSMERVTDKNNAAVASNQILGRSYAELRPLAHQVAQAKELVASATDEEVLRAKAVSEEYLNLKFKIEQKVRVMADQLLPTLHAVIGAFEDTTDEAGNLSEQGEVLATMIKMVSSLGLAAADVFYALGHTIAQVAAAAVAAAHGNFREAAHIWTEANEDIARHTEETNKRIEKVWNATAENVKDLKIAPDEATKAVADEAKRKTNEAVQEVIEFQKHFPEMMAKDQALTQQLAASSKLRAELLAEEGKRGTIGARDLLAKQGELEQQRLAQENEILNHELGLVVKKGDLLKQAEIKAAIDRNNAAIDASRQLTASRINTQQSLEEAAFKTRIAADANRIQIENLSERQRLSHQLIEKQNMIDAAERAGLMGATQAARQRELLELRHQAALGNIHAQGALARRKFDEMDNKQKAQAVFGTLQEITQGVANNNRQMFELNKIASTANAIINTAQGVTLALASYPPPISFAMAAVQLAAGLAQIQAIQSASFGGSSSPPSVGGGAATPTFQAPTVNTGGAGSADSKEPLTIVHFHGANKDEEETVRRFMSAMNEASRNGQRFAAG